MRLPILLILSLAMFPAIAQELPDPLHAATHRLVTVPWFAQIQADVHPYVDTTKSDNPFEPKPEGRWSELSVWYDPSPSVQLKLGLIRVEASPGRLVAVHDNIQNVSYEVSRPGASIAELLADTLPPLWCPWLAIALEQDAGAWPRVGSEVDDRIGWSAEPSAVGGADDGTWWYEYRGVGADPSTRFTLTIYAIPVEDKEKRWQPEFFIEDSARMGNYDIVLSDSATEIEFSTQVFSVGKDATGVPAWTPIDTTGRTSVASLADLMPPPPEIVAGDRLPSIPMSVIDNEHLAVATWRPTVVFNMELGGRRPGALVLTLIRRGSSADEVLFDAAIKTRKARLLASDVVGVIIRPVFCTKTNDVDHLSFLGLGRTWNTTVPPDPTIPEVERHTPGITWCPASLLLDRVAPGADAAIVVIDRSGWIVGVHGEDATPEEIAESIRAAAR